MLIRVKYNWIGYPRTCPKKSICQHIKKAMKKQNRP